MTGFVVPATAVPRLGPEAFARAMRAPRRGIPVSAWCSSCCSASWCSCRCPTRSRERVEEYAARARRRRRDAARSRGGTRAAASGSRSIDFQRSGYMETWDPERTPTRCTRRGALDEAWEMRCDDPELAARWAALRRLPDGSLGHGVCEVLRRARLLVPGTAAAARRRCSRSTTGCTCSPTTARRSSARSRCSGSSRARTTTRARSRLLAMVVSLFETGYLRDAARAVRSTTAATCRTRAWPCALADAMRRGALCRRARAAVPTSWRVDWFARRRPADRRGARRVRRSSRSPSTRSQPGRSSRGSRAASRRTSTSCAAPRPRPPAATYDSYGATPSRSDLAVRAFRLDSLGACID